MARRAPFGPRRSERQPEVNPWPAVPRFVLTHASGAISERLPHVGSSGLLHWGIDGSLVFEATGKELPKDARRIVVPPEHMDSIGFHTEEAEASRRGRELGAIDVCLRDDRGAFSLRAWGRGDDPFLLNADERDAAARFYVALRYVQDLPEVPVISSTGQRCMWPPTLEDRRRIATLFEGLDRARTSDPNSYRRDVRRAFFPWFMFGGVDVWKRDPWRQDDDGGALVSMARRTRRVAGWAMACATTIPLAVAGQWGPLAEVLVEIGAGVFVIGALVRLVLLALIARAFRPSAQDGWRSHEGHLHA